MCPPLQPASSFMLRLTDRQLIHRQYLHSQVWANKRAEALQHYGAICARCGGFGSDVHHKTYDRVGGAELMSDLEVLCRDCHEAHHRAERCARTRRVKARALNRQGIYRMLGIKQRETLCQKFSISPQDLFIRLGHGKNRELCATACRMLGAKYFYEAKPKTGWGNSRQPRSYRA